MTDTVVDLTAVTEGRDVPVSPVLLTVFFISLFSMGWTALHGYQNRDMAVFATGVVFLGLAYAADRFSQGQILRSNATVYQELLSWRLGLVLPLALGSFGFKLSFLSLPTSSEGYLSVLSTTDDYFQVLTNGWWAPFLENFLGIAISINVYHALRKVGLPPWAAALLAPWPAALGFTYLHGEQTSGFRIFAFVVMAMLLNLLFIEDAVEGNQTSTLLVTIMFVGGIHQGINAALMEGGYLGYLATLWSAPGTIGLMFKGIVLFEVGTWILLVVMTVMKLQDDVSIDLPDLPEINLPSRSLWSSYRNLMSTDPVIKTDTI